MIGFRANNRLHVIGTFCNFHVNSKQRETNEVRVKAAITGEERCVATLITAAKEPRAWRDLFSSWDSSIILISSDRLSFCWIMFTVGSVGRHYRSALSVYTRPICQPRSGRHSVDITAECRSNISRVSVEYRSICRPILDPHSTNIRPILGRYLSFERLIIGR